MSRPGGLGDAKAIDDEAKGVFEQAKVLIADKIGADKKDTLEPISYAKQVVAGMNFFFKVKVTKGSDVTYVHARVFRSLSRLVELHSVQTGKSEDAELAYFE